MKDALDSVKTIIENDWTAANTNNRDIGTEIKSSKVYEEGRIDARNFDWVLYYYTATNSVEVPDITYNCEDEEGYVSIKVTTAHSTTTPPSEDHAKLMVDEIERIRKANRKSTDSAFHTWRRIRGPHATHTYSQQYAGGFWSYTIDYRLTSYHNSLG